MLLNLFDAANPTNARWQFVSGPKKANLPWLACSSWQEDWKRYHWNQISKALNTWLLGLDFWPKWFHWTEELRRKRRTTLHFFVKNTSLILYSGRNLLLFLIRVVFCLYVEWIRVEIQVHNPLHSCFGDFIFLISFSIFLSWRTCQSWKICLFCTWNELPPCISWICCIKKI